MNSKSIGNIGEAKVLCKFVELNIPVYIPFGDNEKADLIIDHNGLKKVQVKTSNRIYKNVLIFNSVSTKSNQNGESVFYTSKDIDYYALYHMKTDKIYLLTIEEGTNSVISLRLTLPKNNQTKNIKMASDYEVNKILRSIAQ